MLTSQKLQELRYKGPDRRQKQDSVNNTIFFEYV